MYIRRRRAAQDAGRASAKLGVAPYGQPPSHRRSSAEDQGGPPMSLFGRIFLLNAIVLVVAGAALLLGPVTVSTPVLLTEVLIVCAGVLVVLVANAVLLRVSLAPLHRLTRAMSTTDLLKPVPRLPARGRGEVEIGRASCRARVSHS